MLLKIRGLSKNNRMSGYGKLMGANPVSSQKIWA